jgi:ferredoxin
MSLNKAIRYHKEKRSPYRKSKAFDHSCRNHGSCSYCRSNRLHADRKNRLTNLSDIDSRIVKSVKIRERHPRFD